METTFARTACYTPTRIGATFARRACFTPLRTGTRLARRPRSPAYPGNRFLCPRLPGGVPEDRTLAADCPRGNWVWGEEGSQRVGPSTTMDETTLRHNVSLPDKSCATIETICETIFCLAGGTDLGQVLSPSETKNCLRICLRLERRQKFVSGFVSAWNGDKNLSPGLSPRGTTFLRRRTNLFKV